MENQRGINNKSEAITSIDNIKEKMNDVLQSMQQT
jgi:hypothetical protein